MKRHKKLANNVISVDFNIKSIRPSDEEVLSSNPFAMFVDKNSMNLDDFCNALLSSSKEQKDLSAEIGKSNTLAINLSGREGQNRQTD